jgi:hypothetical protein
MFGRETLWNGSGSNTMGAAILTIPQYRKGTRFAATFYIARGPMPSLEPAVNPELRIFLQSCLILICGIFLGACASSGWKGYRGEPFHDSVYQGGPQRIPGVVQCAYYDAGGEGVAYHDSDAKNNGSGALNPANGAYLNEFRMNEGVDISYTKFHNAIDNNPFNLVQPPEGQLYVGWTAPGEWFNLTVLVEQAGMYGIDLLYTSNRGGSISLDRDGKPLVSSIDIVATRNANDPIAWRQWHHWNVMTNIAQVALPKGRCVLTVHILTQGNMNLATLNFKLVNHL